MSWQWSEHAQRMIGNPSVSQTVSTYMVSLRQRKVLCGHFLLAIYILILFFL